MHHGHRDFARCAVGEHRVLGFPSTLAIPFDLPSAKICAITKYFAFGLSFVFDPTTTSCFDSVPFTCESLSICCVSTACPLMKPGLSPGCGGSVSLSSTLTDRPSNESSAAGNTTVTFTSAVCPAAGSSANCRRHSDYDQCKHRRRKKFAAWQCLLRAKNLALKTAAASRSYKDSSGCYQTDCNGANFFLLEFGPLLMAYSQAVDDSDRGTCERRFDAMPAVVPVQRQR